MSADKALETDFDRWQSSSSVAGDLVWLGLDSSSRTVNFLLEGMDEFSVRNQTLLLSIVTPGPPPWHDIDSWCRCSTRSHILRQSPQSLYVVLLVGIALTIAGVLCGHQELEQLGASS
jgi:hypothetical protein